MALNLVTDRTAEDVRLKTQKGFYTVTDLNRVERAVATINQMLLDIHRVETTLTTKTDWATLTPNSSVNINDTTWFTVPQATRYLNNIQTIAQWLSATSIINLPSSMNGLTYEGANNIEKALEVLYNLTESISNVWYYASELYCGEV